MKKDGVFTEEDFDRIVHGGEVLDLIRGSDIVRDGIAARNASAGHNGEPCDPGHEEMFVFIDHADCWEIYWSGGAGYLVGVEELTSPAYALWLVSRLAKMPWPHTTPARISLLIDDINRRLGWLEG